jgi:hypothetical protein
MSGWYARVNAIWQIHIRRDRVQTANRSVFQSKSGPDSEIEIEFELSFEIQYRNVIDK